MPNNLKTNELKFAKEVVKREIQQLEQYGSKASDKTILEIMANSVQFHRERRDLLVQDVD